MKSRKVVAKREGKNDKNNGKRRKGEKKGRRMGGRDGEAGTSFRKPRFRRDTFPTIRKRAKETN